MRRLALLAGFAVLGVAVAPPLAGLAERLLAVHMTEHLLIVDGAGLLLAVGAPRAVVRAAHPVLALAVWIATFAGWHLPAAYGTALASPALHAVQHLCFLAAGVLFWTALLRRGARPAWFRAPARLALVLAAGAVGAAVGNALLLSGTAFYDAHDLDDQALAGAIMLGEGALVVLGLVAWVFVRWTREAEARQRASERGLAAVGGGHGSVGRS